MVLVGIFLVSNAYAWHEGKHCFGDEKREAIKKKMEERFKEISKELGLTPEQEKELEAQRTENMEKMKELRVKTKDKREALKNELQQKELNMDRINQIHSELKVLHAEMEDNRLEGILKVRSILTLEQFEKFGKLMERHKGLHRGHKKGGKDKVKDLGTGEGEVTEKGGEQ
jgi:Spy/CpxP family protein refolding chaperone